MTEAAPASAGPTKADIPPVAAEPDNAEHQPATAADATTAAESGQEGIGEAQVTSAGETAAEPAAKSKPAPRKRTESAKPGKQAAAKTTARAAAKADAPATAKTTAKSRTRSTAKPDASANGKAPAAKTSRKSTRKRRLQYKVGQQLVYPLQGVGQVRTIEEREFRDQTLLYYVVYLKVSDMTIMVPVDKADELGIRAIVPRSEARSALALIGEEYEPIPTDWKLRYQMNLDLLKAGSVSDIATVVRALYHRSRIKELPILERKLYDNARSLLVDELSFSLGKDKAKIEELINSRLEVGPK